MTPYYDHAGITIYHADCRDALSELADNSVDLIVTSPPYADARAHTYGGLSPDLYVPWFLERATQMRRVLSPSGSFVLNIKEKAVDGERHTYVLDLILALRRDVGFRWVEEYLWHKTTSAPGKWKYRFRDAWERLLHFSVSPDFKMNQESVMVPAGDYPRSARSPGRDESATQSGIGVDKHIIEQRSLVFPTNVLHGAPVTNNTGHSAAFPMWIPDFFIKLFTDPGDVVVDPFMGSGTTIRSAHRLGRRAVGVDVAGRYCALAVEPLAQEVMAL